MPRPSQTPLADWVRDHHEFVFRVAHSLLGNAADAEDATQATFSSLAARDALPKPDSPRAYLARAALNHAKNLIRSESTRRRHEDELRLRNSAEATPSPDPREVFESMDEREAIASAVDQLPDPLRLPIVLHYREGLKYREVAEALECPAGTVAKRISEAKQQLKRRLAQSGVAGGAFVGTGADSILAQLPAPVVPSGLVERLLSNLDAMALASGTASGASSGPAAAATSLSKTTVTSSPAFWMTTVALVAFVAWVIATDPLGSPSAEPRSEQTLGVNDAPRDSTPDEEIPARPVALAGQGKPSPAPATIERRLRIRVVASNGPVDGATVILRSEGTAESETATPVSGEPGLYEVKAPEQLPTADDPPAVLPLDLGDGRTIQLPLLGPRRSSPSGTSTPAPREEPATPTATAGSGIDWKPKEKAAVQTMLRSRPSYEVVVRAPGYLEGRRRIHGVPRTAKTLELSLLKPARRTGIVIGPEGPVANAQLKVVAQWSDPSRVEVSSHPRTTVVQERQVTSDNRGAFTFDQIPAGEYWVEVVASGHQTQRFPLAPTGTSSKFELQPEALLNVRAIDGRTGLPIEGARVDLRQFRRRVTTVSTDRDGWASFLGLAPGQYELWIGEPRSYVPAFSQRVAIDTTPTELECVVQGAELSGTLAIAEGLKSHTMTVRVSSLLSPEEARRSTSKTLFRSGYERRFELGRIEAGRYLFTVHSSRGKGTQQWLDHQEVITVGNDDDLSLDREIQIPSSGFELHPIDERGQPIEANVRFTLETQEIYAGNQRLKDGTPDAFALPPGTYSLLATARGYAPIRKRLEIRAAEVRRVDLVFDAPAPDPSQPNLDFIADDFEINIWQPFLHSEIVALLRRALPEVEIRVDGTLAESLVLERRVVGSYHQNPRQILADLFGNGDYRLEVEGETITIANAE